MTIGKATESEKPNATQPKPMALPLVLGRLLLAKILSPQKEKMIADIISLPQRADKL